MSIRAEWSWSFKMLAWARLKPLVLASLNICRATLRIWAHNWYLALPILLLGMVHPFFALIVAAFVILTQRPSVQKKDAYYFRSYVSRSLLMIIGMVGISILYMLASFGSVQLLGSQHVLVEAVRRVVMMPFSLLPIVFGLFFLDMRKGYFIAGWYALRFIISTYWIWFLVSLPLSFLSFLLSYFLDLPVLGNVLYQIFGLIIFLVINACVVSLYIIHTHERRHLYLHEPTDV